MTTKRQRPRRRPPNRPIVALVCTRCHAPTNGRGCQRCGCPEYRIVRDQQGRLFDQ